MHNVPGALFLLAAAWLAWSAWRRVRAGRGRPAPQMRPSLRVMADIMRPVIQGVLVILAITLSIEFFTSGAHDVLSLFDLAGFLLLLAAYGAWFSIRTSIPPAD